MSAKPTSIRAPLLGVLLVLLPAMFMGGMMGSPGPVGASPVSTIVVNSTADDAPFNDGFCTLREAITNANADDQSGSTDCAAGSGADTITFATNYTVTLDGSQLPIVTTEMTITGHGAANTIIQASPCNPVTLPGGCTPAGYRVFEVSFSGILTLDGLTVRHGTGTPHGGGILNLGTLTVINSSVNDNSGRWGGGIENQNDGTLHVIGSDIRGNSAIVVGGGIDMLSGTLVMTDSAVSNNQAPTGGGICADEEALLEVTGSTISHNSAGEHGGGIEVWGAMLQMTAGTVSDNQAEFGGGIRSIYSDLEITNSTVSNNSADYGGGIEMYGGAMLMTNSTLTANSAVNGGGLHQYYGRAVLHHNLISGNTANTGAEVYFIPGTLTADNYNVFGHSGLMNVEAFAGFAPAATDINATSDGANPTALANILSAALADNGGPTFTHGLVAGSPAIDLVPTGFCIAAPVNEVDQRGAIRNADGDGAVSVNECDSGAYEYLGVIPPTPGSIKVIKTVVGDAPGSDWSFSGNGAIGSFTLPAAGGHQTLTGLTPGRFDIGETRQGGWVPSVSCTPGGETGVDVVILDLSAGEAAECTFTNTQCLPGTYDDGGDVCDRAPAGSFVDTAGATQPMLCAPGTWQDQRGQTSCKLADPGYYVPEPGATEQLECPAGTSSAAGATECTASPPTSFCPADDSRVAALRTDVIGKGMGSPSRAIRNTKITIPNWTEVDSMQAQLAGVEIGQMKWVRFSVKGYPNVQVNAPTSPAVAPATVKWWASGELPASPWVKAAFFFGPKGNRSPRALAVWPTYDTGDVLYADAFTTFNSPGNYVHHSSILQTLSIPATQAAGAEVTVHVALVDVNKDKRPVILTVAAGGVDETRVITKPNSKNSLNIETFVLPNLPAGTSEVIITLESPGVGGLYPLGGDSAAMIGAAANYACAMPTLP